MDYNYLPGAALAKRARPASPEGNILRLLLLDCLVCNNSVCLTFDTKHISLFTQVTDTLELANDRKYIS
jgi:hypothetical protein